MTAPQPNSLPASEIPLEPAPPPRRSGIRLVRTLRPESLPPPPPPPALIALVGLEPGPARGLRDAAPAGVTLVDCGDPRAARATAVLIDARALDRVPRTPERVVVVLAATLDIGIARAAHQLGAALLPAELNAEDLACIAGRARSHAVRNRASRIAWARTELCEWTLNVLGCCGLTQRRAEILALFAIGERRAEIAAILGIGVKKVDHHIGEILHATGQLRLDDVVAAFRERVRRDFGVE